MRQDRGLNLTNAGVSAFMQTVLDDATASAARVTMAAAGIWTAATDPTNGDDSGDGVNVGDIWINTATRNEFHCIVNTLAGAVWRHVPRILGASSAASAHTGDTNETVKATVTVPANALGINGILVVGSTWSYTNSANNKNMRIRLGGIGGTVCMNFTATTTANYSDQRRITNRALTNSQIVSSSSGGTPGGLGTGTNALVAPASDTTAALDLVLTCQLALGSETLTLESYLVQLLRPDIT